jgi:Cys-rich protein (TIGR01571 family)
MELRKNVRERYNIEGGKVEDCCIAFCCTSCDLTQVSRELELEERDLGRS